MPIILSTSNIIIDNGITNFTMETVKTYPFIQKDTVGTINNLLEEPFVDTVSRMYPPTRTFNSNNFTVANPTITIARVACGQNHSLFRTDSGKIYACGINNYGQLGITTNSGTYNVNSTPTLITTTTVEGTPRAFDTLYIVSVTCGQSYTLFRTNLGKVYVCGTNQYGQLGISTNVGSTIANPYPTLITTTTTGGTPLAFDNIYISDIATGLYYTLFLTSAGRVYACGYNQYGQLGITTNSGTNTATSTPTLITTTTVEGTPTAFNNLTISAIACGQNHSVFLTNTGKVYVCGTNLHGQLGIFTDIGTMVPNPNPTLITTTTSQGTAFNNLTISAIACGGNHTMFVTNGSVYACGRNNYGQLGNSSSLGAFDATPTLITTSEGYTAEGAAFDYTNVISISCGNDITVFRTNAGTVYVCGANQYGRLGISRNAGTVNSNPTPILITTTTSQGTAFDSLYISGIGTGAYHTLFLANNGTVYACGYNQYGQLGITTNSGTSATNSTPSLVSFILTTTTPLILYGLGTYTVSYSSFTTSFEPFRCFNNTSSANNEATWAANNYTSGTGIYNKTLNLVSGYNGDWLRIQLPVSIKLRSFAIKQISTALNRAPKNFRFYGSTNGTSWVLLVDKTNTIYTNLFYTHTDMTQYASNTNQFYNHFGIVINSLLGTSETTLSFDELYIYGSEQVTFTRSVVDSTNKLLSFTLLYALSNYPNSDLGYNITFPTPTFVNSISTSTNLILQGEYILNILNSSSSQLIPNGGQTNIINSDTLNLPTTNVQVNYHLLNPLRNNSESAQWTYSPINTSVYHLGNVGIMTKTPSYKLEINNNIYVSGTAFTGSSQTNWVILSDKRIKENIVKASYKTCFENVKNIELYRFNFKDNTVNTNDYNQLGFIAQEIQSVYPKAVEVNKIKDKTGEIPDLLSLNTTQIKYTLYGAVKYLLEKIENLEKKLELKKIAYTGILDSILYFKVNNIGNLDFQENNIKILDYRGNNIGTLDFQ